MNSRAARIVVGVIAVVGSVVSVGQAQRGGAVTPAPEVNLKDISGFWELSFDSQKVPAANLAPGVTKKMIEAKAARDAHAIRWCNLLGTPFIMGQSRPLDIRQGQSEVIIWAETTATPRHLYLNRPTHISDELWDPSTNGDSIAHWEGDTLVVDTKGFAEDKGLSEIPGGGFRTARSHLVERYRLVEGGSVLSVTFTWADPKVFRTPHTYEFRYYRMPRQYEPSAAILCDPYDEERTKFLEGPKAANISTPARR